VDDEAGQQEIFRQYLAPLPIDLEVADGTAAAIELLAAKRYHAIFCDLMMEGGGGREVLRFVKSQGLHTPLIIVTGYGDEETAEECLTAGAFDFLSKPFDRLSFVGVLRRALLRSGLIFEENASPPTSRAPGPFPHFVG